MAARIQSSAAAARARIRSSIPLGARLTSLKLADLWRISPVRLLPAYFILQIEGAPGGGAWIGLVCRETVLLPEQPFSTHGEPQARRASNFRRLQLAVHRRAD